MTNQHIISADRLTEGSLVLIRGKLGYSRLTRLIEGEELVQADARKALNGMIAVGRPHTTATITHAEVLYKDPATPTLEERFVAERCYVSKNTPDNAANYNIDNKSTQLPVIAVVNDQGQAVQDTSGRELAAGLDVTLVLRVYKPKGYTQRGLSLDQIIVNEPAQYYGGGGVDINELAARGIVFAAPPRPMQAPDGADPVSAVPANTRYTEDGFAFPSPAPAAQGQPQPQVAAPTAAPAPARATAPAHPVAVTAAPTAETIDQKVARLQAQSEAVTRTSGGAQAGSALGDDPNNPWNIGITYES